MRVYLFLFFAILSSVFELKSSYSDSFTFHKDGSLSVYLSNTTKAGLSWIAEDVKKEDIAFHQILFGDSKTMAGFAGGGSRSPKSVEDRLKTQWIPRFEAGHPHGGLTVFLKGETLLPIGHVVAGGGDKDDTHGVSEIAYSFLPDTKGPSEDGYGGFYPDDQRSLTLWGKGIASSVVDKIVSTWAPEVRRIGLGIGLDERNEKDMKLIQNFRCFDSKVLGRLDATASPKNPGSWKVLDHNFISAITGVKNLNEPIDWDGRDYNSYEAMEIDLLKLYDSISQDTPLVPGTRYAFVDPDGKKRTLSKHISYSCLKYHFEHILH